MGEEFFFELVKYGTFHRVLNSFKPEYLTIDNGLFGYKLLMAALERQHKTIINFLLRHNCRVVQEDNKNSLQTPLHYAVLLNDFNILRKLLRKGASIKDKNYTGKTALCLAAQSNQFHLVDPMLNLASFEDINPTNVDDIAHFHIACMRNKLKVVEKFVNSGFAINSVSVLDVEKWQGFTPLHFAVFACSPIMIPCPCKETVRYLIDNGADICMKNSQGETPLHLAYYTNTFKHILKEILTLTSHEKKSSNPVDRNGLSHFHLSCMFDMVNIVENFLDNKVDIDHAVSTNVNIGGYTALHFAIESGCVNVVKLLLTKGAKVNKEANGKTTPLHLACKLNARTMCGESIVELLLKYNVNTNAVDDANHTPIHCAFYVKQTSNIINKLLSSASININHADSQGLTIFHIACAQNNTAVVKKFLNQGISIDSCTNSNSDQYPDCSALDLAIQFNSKDVVELLLQHMTQKANNDIHKNLIKSLHLACNFNHSIFYFHIEKYYIAKDNNQYLNNIQIRIEIIKLLLSHGADINAKNSDGKTPIMYACTDVYNQPEELVDTLLKSNANIHLCTNDNSSILHLLAKNSKNTPERIVALCKQFLENGVNVNSLNDAGNSPLHEVFLSYSLAKSKLIELFLNYNANVNAKTKTLNTPLHLFVENLQNYEATEVQQTMELLLNNSNDVNAKNSHGETSLHIALKHGKYKTAQLLFQYGADINSENNFGFPAIGLFYNRKQYYSAHVNNKIKDCIEIHVKKLMAIGFHLSEKVKEFYCLLKGNCLEVPMDMDDVYIQCLEEIDRLKSVRIDNYTTLFDILFKDQNDMANHLNNVNLKVMLADDNLKSKFPLYGYILKLQLKKGLVRSTFMEPAKNSLQVLIGISLPDSCTESIMRYLVNEDLEKLIEVYNQITSVKRKSKIDNLKSEIPTKKQRLLD